MVCFTYSTIYLCYLRYKAVNAEENCNYPLIDVFSILGLQWNIVNRIGKYLTIDNVKHT